MPGGGGGGKARPPDMRLRRERHDGAVVYVDGSPRSALRRWLRALAAFFPGSLLGGFVLFCLMKGILQGRKVNTDGWLAPLAWGLVAAASTCFILARPFGREVQPCERRRALVFRRIYLWGPPREREHNRPAVDALALLERDHGGPYLRLVLVLADGGLRFVEQGKEMDRMREMARDVGAALGLPVTSLPPPAAGSTFGPVLTRLTLDSGEALWVDFDRVGRLVGTWAACVGSVLLSAYAALMAVYAVGEWRPGAKSDVPVIGFVMLALMLFAGPVLFVASVASLRLPRYCGLRLSPKGGCVVLQRLGVFGLRRDETLTPEGATAVIVKRDRKGEPRSVWVERPGGRRLYIDGGKAGRLTQLARDLAGSLHAEVRGERRGGWSRFFWG